MILSQLIPAYEVIKKIGKGSYGKVYKVKRKSDNEIFAMKTLEIISMNQKDLTNTLNEIWFLCSIECNYICGYEESFVINNGELLCIVMEFVGGGDVLSKIRTCKEQNLEINEETIWKYICQILIGLKKLHKFKIIHRDIKSANLFLSEDFEEVKLGDLGIAKLAKWGFGETQVGTPYYLAPEIWQNNHYDYKCDIFSFGCVVYEMAALRVPFQGVSL